MNCTYSNAVKFPYSSIFLLKWSNWMFIPPYFDKIKSLRSEKSSWVSSMPSYENYSTIDVVYVEICWGYNVSWTIWGLPTIWYNLWTWPPAWSLTSLALSSVECFCFTETCWRWFPSLDYPYPYSKKSWWLIWNCWKLLFYSFWSYFCSDIFLC